MKNEHRKFLKAIQKFNRSEFYNAQEVIEAYNNLIKAYKNKILSTGIIPREIKDAKIITEEVMKVSGYKGHIDGLFASIKI